MIKTIYITGVARSGTTLLARMFHAFEGVLVMSQEIQIQEFIQYCRMNPENKSFIVGKRTEHSIFSNILSTQDFYNSKRIIEINDIIIINCVRDGRFVVDSWLKAWGVYNPFIWMQSVMDAMNNENLIRLTIKYEDIISNPDKVQKQIEELIGLKAWTKFNNYPSFVGEGSFETDDPNYIPRKLEPQAADVPETYLTKPNDLITFDSLLKKLDY